jgi:CheY-like chemotaxis protein
MARDSSRRPRVLLVDDSPDEREMYAAWFRLSGYCTLQASSAFEAYRLASELLPDVAVVDIALSGAEDGLHLTRRLKNDGATSALPVVILSGHVFPTDREEAAHAGCDLFVPKPCRPDVLQRIVERLISSSESSCTFIPPPSDLLASS